MSKKKFFAVVDTETTMPLKDVHTGLVADIAIVICDKHGNIVNKLAVLVRNIYGVEPLFYIHDESEDSVWSPQGKDRRITTYNEMLDQGSRMMASVAAVNRWIAQAVAQYNPVLTAYNLKFDEAKCLNTGIDLSMFNSRFCLWNAAYSKWAHTKSYLSFALSIHAFNNRTDKGNMCMKTNAEVMARFCLGAPDLPDEPHMALEDVIGYEIPILIKLVKNTKVKDYMSPERLPSWQHCLLKDLYKPA